MKKSIFIFSGVLLACLLLEMWILEYLPLNVPQNIPATPIRINGLVLILTVLAILTTAHKAMLKKRTGLSVPQLTYYGALICLIAELIYQAIRKSVEGVDSLASGIHYFLLSTAGMTIMGTVFSFFVAFQLKTKKTGWLILFIFLFVLVVYEINYLYPVKNW